MEEIKNKRGGRREGAGRKAGTTTHQMALKLDKDLHKALSSASLNKNRYINDAVRDKMKKDGYIK